MISPGLCATCTHARVITSDRGSTFLRCNLSDTKPEFPRYPRLPVLTCRGWEPASGRPASSTSELSE